MTSSSGSILFGLCIVMLVCRFVNSVDICKEKDNANFSLTLQGALTFKKYLLLFDQDWLVYEVPYGNLENSYGQLLMNITGKPLTEYWPLFASNPQWPEIASTITNIYHVEKVNAYVYFVAPGGWNNPGVCYTVQDAQWCRTLYYYEDTVDVMVTDTWEHQYTLQWTDGVMALRRWWTIWVEGTGEIHKQGANFLGHLYYTVDPDTKARNLTLINKLYPAGSKDNPCAHNRGFELYKLEQLDWGEQGYLPKGFVYKNYFYIYAQKNVFIIEDLIRNVADYPARHSDKILASAPVKKVRVKDYFQCRTADLHNYTYPPSIAPNADNEVKNWNSKGGGIPWWVWLIVVILIMGVLVLLLWCVFARKKKNKTKHKSRHSHGHSLHTRKGTSKGSRKASHRSVKGTAEQVTRGGSMKQRASAKGVTSNHQTRASRRVTARSADRGGGSIQANKSIKSPRPY